MRVWPPATVFLLFNRCFTIVTKITIITMTMFMVIKMVRMMLPRMMRNG